MKKIIFILLLIPVTQLFSQRIGEFAPERPPEEFPDNSWGVDLMFGDGGFGLGTFYRYSVSRDLSIFGDLSFSESSDKREIEYYDYWGNKVIPFKENRVFILPLNVGVHYRLFTETITETLRPYIGVGVGPTMIVTTPYNMEYFDSFGKAKAKFAAGGYVCFGANIGSSKSNLVGLNFRYYFIHMFDEGVENMQNSFKKDLGHFYLTLNIGLMY
ncbi:MAG: hypothetical protein V1720_04380 [bacterium]